MEKEILDLRKQLAGQTSPVKTSAPVIDSTSRAMQYPAVDQYGSNEAAEGLMGLSGGWNLLKRIEDVLITQECLSNLVKMQVFYRTLQSRLHRWQED